MDRYKIRAKNSKESMKVQKELFRRGYTWASGDRDFLFLDNPHFFVNNRRNYFTCCKDRGFFDEHPAKEITVKQLLGGKKMKKFKPTHIVIWEEDTDPHKLINSLETTKEFVKILLKNPDVVEDSIVIYEIKSITVPKLSITFKKG